jgi:LuxR family transcriptional regulator, maltose regulon positive regulatory protein
VSSCSPSEPRDGPRGYISRRCGFRDLDDPDVGVQEFAGSARQVGDYLSDEVLSGLAPETRDFLLRTSVLGRFTPELCDSVLGRNDSAAVLAGLARSNMFLVALDARGEWYRYHHLFGEVLQLELGGEPAVDLRRRAAAWCCERGLVEDAIEYAAAATDAELVAQLLEDHHMGFVWGARLGQYLGWMRWLPQDVLERHPLLPSIGAVAAAVQALPEIEIRRLLVVAEGVRSRRPELWSPYIEAAVDLTRAAAIPGGDVGGAVESARRALAVAREGNEVLVVGALGALAQALFFSGDLDEARQNALEGVERPEAASRPVGYLGSLGLLALVDAERGRFESAEAWARQALSFARERFLADTWVASLAHLGLALACAGTGRLDEAEREAERGETLRRSPQPTVGHAHALLVLAQIRVSRSRLARAASDLERARRAISEFSDPGRLPALADMVEHKLAAARLSAGNRSLVEEPSPAELAVLRGLAVGLSRREIGERLFISLNTVKTHTRELYRKLGVSSQAGAVARAEALGLLDRTESPG